MSKPSTLWSREDPDSMLWIEEADPPYLVSIGSLKSASGEMRISYLEPLEAAAIAGVLRGAIESREAMSLKPTPSTIPAEYRVNFAVEVAKTWGGDEVSDVDDWAIAWETVRARIEAMREACTSQQCLVTGSCVRCKLIWEILEHMRELEPEETSNRKMREDPAAVPKACDHRFVYAGLRYRKSLRNLPGSGARKVYYAQSYYCERCLEHRAERLDLESNTYGEILSGASPGSEAEMPRKDFP